MEDLSFSRISGTEIQLQWSGSMGSVCTEISGGTASWEQIGILDSEQIAKDETLTWKDTVPGERKNQYEFRINVKVKDSKKYQAQEGRTILASTLLICIDPGHYGGKCGGRSVYIYRGRFYFAARQKFGKKIEG